jgi:hypothetical protein
MRRGAGVSWFLALALAWACESRSKGTSGEAVAVNESEEQLPGEHHSGEEAVPLTLDELAWTPGAHATQNFVPGNCCVAREEPGCEVARVQVCVCAIDPSCCELAWTEKCAGLVSASHCASCGGRGLAGPDCGTSACSESWCGSRYENQCPEAWALDSGCDCGCQFEDPVCMEAR